MKRLIGLAFLLAACGGDDDSVDKFIGTWTYNAGSTSTLDCQENALDSNTTQTGTFQIAAGTTSDLIEVPDSDSKCPPVRYDVSGNVATIQAGQTCMYTETDNNVTYTVNIAQATGTYTLSADGKMVTGSASGSVMFTATGFATTCTGSGSMSATKTGN